jgi:hypothetical protein
MTSTVTRLAMFASDSAAGGHMGFQANIETTVNPIEHVRVRTAAPFSDVVHRLETETGLFDGADIGRRLAAGEPRETVIEAINAMAGPSGFMRFLAADHGAILRLHGRPVDAIRFLIGHPLIAVRMTTHATGSALYAPLSLLVVSDGHGTQLEYDQPSSLLSQFHDAAILETARELDHKLDALIHSITAPR